MTCEYLIELFELKLRRIESDVNSVSKFDTSSEEDKQGTNGGVIDLVITFVQFVPMKKSCDFTSSAPL